jgi:hypothetical protein
VYGRVIDVRDHPVADSEEHPRIIDRHEST